MPLPEDYSLFETYRLDYGHYFFDGKKTAESIVNKLRPYTVKEPQKILEWGCGPARIVRHLPALLPGSEIHGCDYNAQTVEWCRLHIKDAIFSKNELVPPLAYSGNFFDMVFAISVFTHLSRENHFLWMREIHRVLKPGGLFLFTTQGDSFLPKLTSSEKERYTEGELVARSEAKEGHRLFSSFTPPVFIRLVLGNEWQLLEFVPGTIENGSEQDTWIIKKRTERQSGQ